MEWGLIPAWILGGAFILFPVAFVGYLSIRGLYEAVHKADAKKDFAEMVCSIDADCPEGYLCVSGRCVLAS
jgi:hypothetical protein